MHRTPSGGRRRQLTLLPRLMNLTRSLCLCASVTLVASVVADTATAGAHPKRVGSHGVRYAEVASAAQIVLLPHNRLLVTDFGGDNSAVQVVETDFHDHLLWRYANQLSNPHSAYPVKNGDVMIADTGNNRVIEVNRRGHIAWDTDDLRGGHGKFGQGRLSDGTHLNYPNDAKPLANGDVMISCREQNRVIVINRKGKVLREVTSLHGQHNPVPLSHGDLLIPDSDWNEVVEVNQSNRIVWRYGGPRSSDLSWPRSAVPLSSSDILVTDSGHNRVIEITRSGSVVHAWNNLARPYAAVPSGNGSIIVGDGPSSGLVELNSRGQITWRLNHNSSVYLGGLPSHVQNGNFEKAYGSGPADWVAQSALAYSKPPPVMVRDEKVRRVGHASARITYDGNSNGIDFSQALRVNPGTAYRFSGWIKTDNVRACHPCSYGPSIPPGHTAEYEILFVAGEGADPQAPLLRFHSGTIPWTRDEVTFRVPRSVSELAIQCYLRGAGTVWFDGVSLKPV